MMEEGEEYKKGRYVDEYNLSIFIGRYEIVTIKHIILSN
jgi:hypothetical protein